MKAKELQGAIIDILMARLAPFITGSPGCGKSDIIREVAKSLNLQVIDLRLSQEDPTSLCGFPTHDGVRMGYAPPEHFPLQGIDKPPPGKLGFLLFLDEFNSASMATQSAAYRLVLDRQVGKYDLHMNCAIVCAGNKETDGAITNRLSTAMQSRLVHLELDVDVQEWLQWASVNQLDHRVISYIESRPDHLHQFKPNHDNKTFSCPRTWEFASRLVKDKEPNPVLLEILCGTLSVGIATEFNAHMTYCSKLPSFKEIMAAPLDIPLPEDPAMLFAVSHMTAAYINEDNASEAMKYVKRLPLEFSTTSIRSALKRDKGMLQIPAVRAWTHEVSEQLF